MTRLDEVREFADNVDLLLLGAALHHLRPDHTLVIVARLGLQLGDERRAIADEMKQVALAVHAGWTEDPVLRLVRSRPARFVGVPREPVRCDVCHGRTPGKAEAA